jgi:hypothetical protein
MGVDVNGDGRDDLLWYEGSTLSIIGSTGTGLGQWQATNTLGAPQWAGVGDLDGDRKDDLWWYENGTLHVFGSTGSRFGAWQRDYGLGLPSWAAYGSFPDTNGSSTR